MSSQQLSCDGLHPPDVLSDVQDCNVSAQSLPSTSDANLLVNSLLLMDSIDKEPHSLHPKHNSALIFKNHTSENTPETVSDNEKDGSTCIDSDFQRSSPCDVARESGFQMALSHTDNSGNTSPLHVAGSSSTASDGVAESGDHGNQVSSDLTLLPNDPIPLPGSHTPSLRNTYGEQPVGDPPSGTPTDGSLITCIQESDLHPSHCSQKLASEGDGSSDGNTGDRKVGQVDCDVAGSVLVSSDDWPSILHQGVSGLWRQQALCDVMLQTQDGHLVAAHKCVLAATSNWFLTQLEVKVENATPSALQVVQVDDVRHETLVHVLTFIYEGRVKIAPWERAALIDAASLLQFSHLQAACSLPNSRPKGECSSQYAAPRPRSIPTEDRRELHDVSSRGVRRRAVRCVDTGTDGGEEVTEVPVKRKRGRPKGSTKGSLKRQHVSKENADNKRKQRKPRKYSQKDDDGEDKEQTEPSAATEQVPSSSKRCQVKPIVYMDDTSNDETDTEHVEDASLWSDAPPIKEETDHTPVILAEDDVEYQPGAASSISSKTSRKIGRKSERRKRGKRGLVDGEKRGKTEGVNDGPLPCNVCGKMLSRKCRLEEHMRLHTGERPFPCTTCDKSFVSYNALKAHEYIHQAGAKLSCEECNITFTSKHSYTYHMRFKHIRGRDLMCQHCGKCYRYPESLKFHENSCQGRKPYKCPKCSKGFAIRSMIYKHMATHSEEFSFQCSVCGKRFSRQDNLNVHMRIHSGEKPYNCSMCGMAFRVKCSLQAHEKSEHGIKSQVSKPRDEPMMRRRNPSTNQQVNTPTTSRAPVKAIASVVNTNAPELHTMSVSEAVGKPPADVVGAPRGSVGEGHVNGGSLLEYQPPCQPSISDTPYAVVNQSIMTVTSMQQQQQLPPDQHYIYTQAAENYDTFSVPRPYNQFYN